MESEDEVVFITPNEKIKTTFKFCNPNYLRTMKEIALLSENNFLKKTHFIKF